MKVRGPLAAVAVALLVVGLVAPAGTAAGKKKPAGPVVVGTDPADDWGSNAGAPAEAGTALGMELVEASLTMADKETLNFVLKLNGLPASGGIPEAVRYAWDFTSDGVAYHLSGGFTELIRGTCNPLVTDPPCPPNVGDPATNTDGPFFLRQGPCTTTAACTILDTFNATFDPATSTITIPVPLEAIEAKPGTKIGPGAGPYGTIYSSPQALVTVANVPMDSMIALKTYVVPR